MEKKGMQTYINVNIKTLYLARSTLSNLRRIWTDKAMLKKREKHLTYTISDSICIDSLVTIAFNTNYNVCGSCSYKLQYMWLM